MEKTKLSFELTLKDAISIGVKNAPSIVGCVLLWIVTIWIPWINVGTTIAILTLPIELSKGNIISPTSIFDAKYRKYFGEVFLTLGLVQVGVFMAMLFMFVPGVILSIAWGLAIYFVLDKGMNPTQALTASNEATSGNKWTIFLVSLVLGICLAIVGGILIGVVGLIGIGILSLIVMIAVYVVIFSVMTAANASIYRQLKDNV